MKEKRKGLKLFMPKFYLLGNATNSQMFGFIVKTKTATIVFDGGSVGDFEQLADFLAANCNNRVDAWFFTHPHHDHIGAFCEFYRNKVNIQVDNIFHCFPSFSDLVRFGDRSENELLIWRDLQILFSGKLKPTVKILQKNDCFMFDEVTIKVLRIFNKDISLNYVNNSSTVYRIETPNTSYLLLGDLGVEGGEELMEICSLEDLQTDYTQMAHHGQRGVSKEFYEYIKPKRCIWPTPDWLWDNDAGNGFNTGPWQTVQTRMWMDELGVTEHWIEKDGTQRIEKRFKIL